MHVERTFSVPRPIDEVFTFLGDFTHSEQWDPGTVSTTRTGGDGGLGTTYHNVSEFMGRRVELTYDTITYDAPHRVQFRGRNSSSTATDSMSFTVVSDTETSIHYRADFEFTPLLRLVAPLVVGRKLGPLADETVAQIRRTLA